MGGVEGKIIVDEATMNEHWGKSGSGGGEQIEIGPTADARDNAVRGRMAAAISATRHRADWQRRKTRKCRQ